MKKNIVAILVFALLFNFSSMGFAYSSTNDDNNQYLGKKKTKLTDAEAKLLEEKIEEIKQDILSTEHIYDKHRYRANSYLRRSSNDNYSEETENNDSIGRADRIRGENHIMYGTIDSEKDVDYYKIRFDSDGEAEFYLANIPSSCDYDLYLLDSRGRELDDSTHAKNRSESIKYNVRDGRYYYLKVESYRGSSPRDYELIAYVRKADNRYESNDSLDDAYRLREIDSYEVIDDANISNDDDEDWYSFSVPYSSRVEIRLDDIPRGCDYDIKLYGPREDRINRSSNNDNDSEKMEKYIAGDETYYIKVYSRDGESSKNYELSIDVEKEFTRIPRDGLNVVYEPYFYGGRNPVVQHDFYLPKFDAMELRDNLELNSHGSYALGTALTVIGFFSAVAAPAGIVALYSSTYIDLHNDQIDKISHAIDYADNDEYIFIRFTNTTRNYKGKSISTTDVDAEVVSRKHNIQFDNIEIRDVLY